MKVMLDTNILISAFVFKSKKMNELIYRLSKEHEIIICSYTVEELKELKRRSYLQLFLITIDTNINQVIVTLSQNL